RIWLEPHERCRLDSRQHVLVYDFLQVVVKDDPLEVSDDLHPRAVEQVRGAVTFRLQPSDDLVMKLDKRNLGLGDGEVLIVTFIENHCLAVFVAFQIVWICEVVQRESSTNLQERGVRLEVK